MMNKTMTGRVDQHIAFPLSYGSADLSGFKWRDTVCLNPIYKHDMYEINSKTLQKAFCIQNFKYQAAVVSKGLDRCDGILGLSPKDYGTHSIIPELKRAGLI